MLVMVNIMCQFDWAKGCPDSWYILFLDMFLEEIIIQIGELNKADDPPQCEWASSSNFLRAQMSKKTKKGWVYSLPAWAETSIFSCPWTLALLVLVISDSDWDLHYQLLILQAMDMDWITPIAFLVHQLADSRSLGILANITTLANSYNKFPLIYICNI